MNLLEWLRRNNAILPSDTQPLRVVRNKPARRPGLDRWAWQVGTEIIYTNAGEKPEVRR